MDRRRSDGFRASPLPSPHNQRQNYQTNLSWLGESKHAGEGRAPLPANRTRETGAGRDVEAGSREAQEQNRYGTGDVPGHTGHALPTGSDCSMGHSDRVPVRVTGQAVRKRRATRPSYFPQCPFWVASPRRRQYVQVIRNFTEWDFWHATGGEDGLVLPIRTAGRNR
jgi:hypothetical protein